MTNEESLRANEMAEYFVAFRVRGKRRDVRVEATWITAEKTARALVGNGAEFIGLYPGRRLADAAARGGNDR